MNMVEVYPFTKFSWFTNDIMKEWEPLRTRIYQATNFAEYEMVKRGYREADVYQLDPDKFDIQIKKVNLDGLTFLPILRSKTYGGYGHRHYTTNTIDKDTFIYGVVARDREAAIRFHDASVVHTSERINEYPTDGIDHREIGRMLGYPDCCIDFFNDVWLKDGCLDPMSEMALNTDGARVLDNGAIEVSGHPYLNRLIRYFGFNIVPFFPCSFKCQEAIGFAKTWFSLMREYDEEAADACLEAQSVPMVWSLKNCITYIEHPLFIGSANGYYTEQKKEVRWLP